MAKRGKPRAKASAATASTSGARSIVQLTRALDEGPTIDDLKASLQLAAELELATLPPYLTAYWSIKQANSVAAHLLSTIWNDEMYHLANVCNVLSGIGGTPDLRDHVPVYPGRLPGGVHPGLVLALEGFSTSVVRSFMEVEYPQFDPVARLARVEYGTVGEFYAAIIQAIADLQPKFDTARQVDQIEIPASANAADAIDVLKGIAQQGEGSKDSPKGPGSSFAHYYRFAEIYYGHLLQSKDGGKTWAFDGDAIPHPETHPVAEVPACGYDVAKVSKEVADLLKDFDGNYSDMLRAIEATWADKTADDSHLDEAISHMKKLPGIARSLVALEIAPDSGNYAPCFRYVT